MLANANVWHLFYPPRIGKEISNNSDERTDPQNYQCYSTIQQEVLLAYAKQFGEFTFSYKIKFFILCKNLNEIAEIVVVLPYSSDPGPFQPHFGIISLPSINKELDIAH